MIAATLSKCTVIPVDSSVARLAGSLLRSVGGNKAHFGDAIIAAAADRQGETILTADAVSQRVFGHRVNYLEYRCAVSPFGWALPGTIDCGLEAKTPFSYDLPPMSLEKKDGLGCGGASWCGSAG